MLFHPTFLPKRVSPSIPHLKFMSLLHLMLLAKGPPLAGTTHASSPTHSSQRSLVVFEGSGSRDPDNYFNLRLHHLFVDRLHALQQKWWMVQWFCTLSRLSGELLRDLLGRCMI